MLEDMLEDSQAEAVKTQMKDIDRHTTVRRGMSSYARLDMQQCIGVCRFEDVCQSVIEEELLYLLLKRFHMQVKPAAPAPYGGWTDGGPDQQLQQ
jgi:hypothetical protein